LCWPHSVGQNHLLCNVAAFTGMPYISKSSDIQSFISLIWKEPYYDKLQVSQGSRRLFQYSRKIMCRFQLREVESHVSVWTT
jgi:hypothetical protein